jgi:hypothetical protein
MSMIVLRNRIVFKEIQRKRRGGTKELITVTRYITRSKVPKGYSIGYKLTNGQSISFEGHIKYKLGCQYQYNGRIRLSESGFHYSPNPLDCLAFVGNSGTDFDLNLFKVYVREESKQESAMGEDHQDPIKGVTSSIIIAERFTKTVAEEKLTGFVPRLHKFFGRVYDYYDAAQWICTWYPQRGGLILPIRSINRLSDDKDEDEEEGRLLCAEADNIEEAENICQRRATNILRDIEKDVSPWALRPNLGIFIEHMNGAEMLYISPFIGIGAFGSFSRKKNLRIKFQNNVYFWSAPDITKAQKKFRKFCRKRRLIRSDVDK